MTYKLVFADGTEVDNLSMNGNTLISETDVSQLLGSEEAMREVTLIETDEQDNATETVYQYAKTNGAYLKESGYNFTIWGADPTEIKIKELEEQNQMLVDCLLEMSEIVYDG